MKLSKSVKEKFKINLLKSTHGKNENNIETFSDEDNEENDEEDDDEEEEEKKAKPKKKVIKVRAIQADRLKKDKKYLSSLVRITQCRKYANLLTHFFDKNFVKATFLTEEVTFKS